ncbi:MAG TPA: hypothetical protein DCS97_04180 [Planctomycetes bacterium]|nr:hypothetical protein [Planctomycetota bacterium]
MRCAALFLLTALAVPAFAEDAAPAGADPKAQMKELEMKMKAVREQAVKDDPELVKLKTEADDLRKRYETAVEAKLKDNADYQALKAQADELRGKKKKKDEKKPEAPPADQPKGEQPKL